MPRKGFAGAAVPTTITSAIAASGTTTFTIASATGWTFTNGGGPFTVVINRGFATEEKILCTSISGTTITIGTRGYDGTTAAAHSSPEKIVHVFDSIEAESSNAHVFDTTRNDHTQYARLVGAAFTGAVTFPNGTGFDTAGNATIATSASTGGVKLGSAAAGTELKLDNNGVQHWSIRNAGATLQVGTTGGASTLGSTLTTVVGVTVAGAAVTGTLSATSTITQGGTAVVLTNDSRLSDARTPSNDALLAHLAGTETFTGSKTFSAAAALAAGSTMGGSTLVTTNDSRLSDARTPSNDANLVHIAGTETISGAKTFSAAAALAASSTMGGSVIVTTNDTRLAVQAAGTASIRAIGVNGTDAVAGNDIRLTPQAVGTASVRSLGTGSTQAAAGDDSRFNSGTNSEAVAWMTVAA